MCLFDGIFKILKVFESFLLELLEFYIGWTISVQSCELLNDNRNYTYYVILIKYLLNAI